jgi:hypothetical protein
MGGSKVPQLGEDPPYELKNLTKEKVKEWTQTCCDQVVCKRSEDQEGSGTLAGAALLLEWRIAFTHGSGKLRRLPWISATQEQMRLSV